MVKIAHPITWQKEEAQAVTEFLGISISHDNYVCIGHQTLVGISIRTVRSANNPAKSFISVKTNDTSLIGQLQPDVSLRLGVDTYNAPPFTIKVENTDLLKQSSQFMAEMINAVDKIAPIPSKIIDELVEKYGLDKRQFVVRKEKTASEVAYAATMIKQVNRQTGNSLPLAIQGEIAKFAISEDNLSLNEENRAAKYGLTAPKSKEAIAKETKGTFTDKILNESRNKDTLHK